VGWGKEGSGAKKKPPQPVRVAGVMARRVGVEPTTLRSVV
jgi:hypothetical protein